MIISHSVVPNGGWQFTEGKVLLLAETFDLLVKNVESHRKYNGIPIGNVALDIETQISDKHPELKRQKALA